MRSGYSMVSKNSKWTTIVNIGISPIEDFNQTLTSPYVLVTRSPEALL